MTNQSIKAYATFESFEQDINSIDTTGTEVEIDNPIENLYQENVANLPNTIEDAYKQGLEDMHSYIENRESEIIEEPDLENPSGPPIVNEENSLKDLVGKSDDEELDLDDARTIGKKISKMKGDDRKKYVGIVNFMGASCRIYNEIWANYKPVDPSKKKSNKGKEFRGNKDIK